LRNEWQSNFLDYGEVHLDLGSPLFQRWQQAGSRGSGFQIVSNQAGLPVLKLLNGDATWIYGVPLPFGEDHRVRLEFKSRTSLAGAFVVDVTQMGPNQQVIGGMTYQLRTGPNPDQDGDGMDDPWELAHGLKPNDPSDAGGDLDHDGVTNLGEFIAGTNPQDPQSYLRIDEIALEQGAGTVAARIRFFAVANKTYTVEFAGSVTNRTWHRLTNISAAPTDRVVEVIDPAIRGGADQRLYRLKTPRGPEF
jgi:hypothetical protein